MFICHDPKIVCTNQKISSYQTSFNLSWLQQRQSQSQSILSLVNKYTAINYHVSRIIPLRYTKYTFFFEALLKLTFHYGLQLHQRFYFYLIKGVKMFFEGDHAWRNHSHHLEQTLLMPKTSAKLLEKPNNMQPSSASSLLVIR